MRWSLHKTTLLTGAIALGGLFGIVVGVFYVLVGPHFMRLEREKQAEQCARFVAAIDAEVMELDRLVFDWAAWDDTYEYVVHPNEEYARKNLIPETFAGLHVQIFSIVDSTGRLVYTGAYDEASQQMVEFPTSVAKELFEGGVWKRLTNELSDVKGICAVPEGLLLVAMRPIITSRNQGPIRGVLLMGRWLDDGLMSTIAARTRVPVKWWRTGEEGKGLPAGIREMLARMTQGRDNEVERCMVGYALLRDLNGRPVGLVQSKYRHSLYREGTRVMKYYTVLMAVAGAGMWVVYMGLLRWLVVRRVARLSAFARRVAARDDAEGEVLLGGGDELGQLATDINAMVRRLRTARDAERARRERVARFSAELVEMARHGGRDYEAVRREILTRTSAALHVTRVSFWRFLEGGKAIRCEELYDATSGSFTGGECLRAGSYPVYFQTLANVQLIAADDAVADVRTREFAETYLRPHGITSMMDAPVRVRGDVIGIVCCEHTGPRRTWALEEQEFVKGVADLLALACETAERRRVEERLRENERRLSLAQEFGRIGAWEWDLRSGGTKCSEVTREILGVRDSGTEIEILEYVHPHDRPEVERAIQECVAKGRPYDIEHRIVRSDGGVRWIAARGNVERNERGEAVRLLGVCMDITERKETELALAAEKERLAVTLRSLGEGVITTDKVGRVVLMNQEAERLTGWTQQEAQGREVQEVLRLYHEETREPVRWIEKEGVGEGVLPHEDEALLITRDGAERPVAWRRTAIRDQKSVVIGSVVVFQDIGMRRRAEQELLRAEKLQSIGILAGGIAHDFNNLLTVILGNISLARMQAEADEELRRCLTEAEGAITEAIGLTKQLLAFAKGGAPIRKPVDVKELLTNAVQFVCRGSAVRWTVEVGDQVWPVIADAGQLSQVIHNLVINALQAMERGGQVRVGAENAVIESGEVRALQPGRYVRIWVSDTGVGIPREHLTKIFDPYFSTKPQGSGLGLAVSYSIIKSHHGHIEVESEVGKGSTFSVYLPAAAEPVERERRVEKVLPGGGHVLLVDDEEDILATTGTMLRRLGYSVEAVRDGEEAVRLYCRARSEGMKFDVVILDLTIPGGLGGVEIVRRLREVDPCVVAIASSGYSNDPVMAEYERYGFRGVLTKPYTLHRLSVAVQEALKRSRAQREEDNDEHCDDEQ